jgi:hypothetical protein
MRNTLVAALAAAAAALPYGGQLMNGVDPMDPRRQKPPITLQQIRTMNGNPTVRARAAPNSPSPRLTRACGRSQRSGDPASHKMAGAPEVSRQQDQRRAGQVKSVRHEVSSMFRHSDYPRRMTDLEDALISMELMPRQNDPQQVMLPHRRARTPALSCTSLAGARRDERRRERGGCDDRPRCARGGGEGGSGG